MTDDETSADQNGEQEENPDRIQAFPIPWSLELGSAVGDDGEVFGIFDIYTFAGHTRLFFNPEFGIQMSNFWHNISVKLKRDQEKTGGRRPSGLVVAETDLSKLDLGNMRKDGS